MQKYVAGFMFNDTKDIVLLIKKIKPEWQKGKLNAIGGKIEIEINETPIQAMVREFKEETGIKTLEEDWSLFCTLVNIEWGGEVSFFKSVGPIFTAKQIEDEEPVACNVSRLGECGPMMHNLPWLINLAITNASANVTEHSNFKW